MIIAKYFGTYLVHRQSDSGWAEQGDQPKRDRAGVVHKHLDEIHQAQYSDGEVTQNTSRLKNRKIITTFVILSLINEQKIILLIFTKLELSQTCVRV